MNFEQKINRWAEIELRRNLDHLILEDSDGRLFAFGEFTLIPHDNACEVYRNNELQGRFSNRSIALSWCVARQKNIMDLAVHIEKLDQHKQMLRNDIRVNRKLADKSRDLTHSRLIRSKLQSKLSSFEMIESALEKCVMRAKYLQTRGFVYETARSSAA